MENRRPTDQEIKDLFVSQCANHPKEIAAFAGENIGGYPTWGSNIMEHSELNRLAAEGKTITLAAVTLENLLEEEPAPVAEIVEPAREEPFSGSLLDMPLEDLDLSLRTRVSLEGHGVTTLRQLLQMTVSDCRKVRNMTQEGLDEIEYQLGLMRFSLKDEY